MSEYTSYEYETQPGVMGSTLAAASGIGFFLAGAAVTAATLAFHSLRSMQAEASARVDELESQGTSSTLARVTALQETPYLEAAVLKELSQASKMEMAGREVLLDSLGQMESTEMDSLIQRGHNRLLLGQTTVLRDSVKSVLEELDYEILAPKRPLADVVVIKGVRRSDSTAVSIRITPKEERLETDLSGFKDGSCQLLLQEAENMLRRRGVLLKMTQRESHGCAGGALTEKVEKLLYRANNSEPGKHQKEANRNNRASLAHNRIRG